MVNEHANFYVDFCALILFDFGAIKIVYLLTCTYLTNLLQGCSQESSNLS